MPTDHFQIKDNEVLHRIKLKADITFAAALFYYYKSGNIKTLIHLIKYSKRKDLAYKLGRVFACRILESEAFNELDYIIPIPTHWMRRLKRGFNQSEVFAKGISKGTKARLLNSVLLKRENKTSLTKKGREGRFEQVNKGFILKEPQVIFNKSILLVDDVMTTGATMESAIELLLKAKVKRLYIGLMALAIN